MAACGSKGSSADAGDAAATIDASSVQCNTTEPLAQCAAGWQFDPIPNPCACNIKNTPECANADCRSEGVTGYLAGGVEIEAVIFYSPTSGTMSTWSDVLRGQWSLADGGITETLSGGKFACASCDSAGGVCYLGCDYNHSAQVPASAGWAAALNAAVDAGNSWTAWPVSP